MQGIVAGLDFRRLERCQVFVNVQIPGEHPDLLRVSLFLKSRYRRLEIGEFHIARVYVFGGLEIARAASSPKSVSFHVLRVGLVK